MFGKRLFYSGFIALALKDFEFILPRNDQNVNNSIDFIYFYDIILNNRRMCIMKEENLNGG